MRPVPPTVVQDTSQTEETQIITKSKKSKYPKSPRNYISPQMKSRSTSNDPYLSGFTAAGAKNSQEMVDKKESVENEKSRGSVSSPAQPKTSGIQTLASQVARDKNFIETKLRDILYSDTSNYLKFDEIKNQFYELAASVDDDGLRLMVNFSREHEALYRLLGITAYRAIEDGNTGLFVRLKKCMPGTLFQDGINVTLKKLVSSSATGMDIHQAISVIKVLLKDGVDCSREQAATIAEWARKRCDQELAGLLARDEKFAKIILDRMPMNSYSDMNKVKDRLYELASSVGDDGLRLVVDFTEKHKRRQDLLGDLAYRALEDGNITLFARLRDNVSGFRFMDGINVMMKKLISSSASDTDNHQAISVITMLLKDGVACTKEQANSLMKWAETLGDQELAGLLVRDENFVKIRLQQISSSKYFEFDGGEQIRDQLYELAASADDDGVRLIVEFMRQYKPSLRLIEVVGYRAMVNGNTRLFARIREHVSGNRFPNGVYAMVTKLVDSSATEADSRHAISVIKMLLNDGVEYTKEQAKIIAEWAGKLNDQDLITMLETRI